MINDPKSAHFISWTELGTRYVNLMTLLYYAMFTQLVTALLYQMLASSAVRYWGPTLSTTM